MQTRFDSFEQRISQDLAGVKDLDLAGMCVELVALWDDIENIVAKLLPTF